MRPLMWMLLLAATTALSQISPEFPVTTVSDIVAAPGENIEPEVAWNGREFLVVWTWLRGPNTGAAVFGARLRADGTPIDVTPFVISPEGRNPDVVWIGTRYVVAYDCAEFPSPRVCFAFIEEDGTVGPHPLGSIIQGYDASLAWSGSLLLILAGGFTAMDAEGRIVSAGRLTDGGMGGASVAWNGEHFIVVWGDGQHVISRTLDRNGNLSSSPQIVGVGGDPVIAAGTTQSLVVWRDSSDGVDSQRLIARRLDRAGVPVGDTSLLASGVLCFAHTGWLRHLAVSSDGEQFLVAYSAVFPNDLPPLRSEADVHLVAIDSSGRKVRETRRQVPLWQFVGSAIWNGTAHLVVWQDYRFNRPTILPVNPQVFGTFADRNAVTAPPGSDLLISRSYGDQETGSIEWNGGGFVTAWAQSIRADRTRAVFLGRLELNRTTQNGRGVRLHFSDSDQAWPRVALTPGGGLVVWTERRPDHDTALYGRRLSANGEVIGEPVIISEDADFDPPAIASDGETFLVAWRDAALESIWVARVDRNLQIISPPQQLAVATVTGSLVEMTGDHAPAIAWDGRNYLVAWQSTVQPGCGLGYCYPVFTNRIKAILVTRSGSPLGTAFPLSEAGSGPLTVVSSGTEFLVVFADSYVPEFDVLGYSVLAVRISPAGTVLNAPRRLVSPNPGRSLRSAAVTWSGKEYVVASAYRRTRQDGRVEVGRLDRDAVNHGVVGAVVAAGPGTVALSRAPAQWIGLKYERTADEDPFQAVKRLFARFIANVDQRQRGVRR